MDVYILVDTDSGTTYGVYKTLQDAQKNKKVIYDNGFYGSLDIQKDTMED